VHLVQPGYNGFIFTRRNAEALANYMSRISAMSDIQLTAMSRASHCLSQQFSPQKWTDTLLDAYSCAAQTGRVLQNA
jgi:glycogen synthase